MLNELLINYINSMPKKVVKKIDINASKIEYDGIIQHREIKVINGEEELVRAFLLTKLVNECGYATNLV